MRVGVVTYLPRSLIESIFLVELVNGNVVLLRSFSCQWWPSELCMFEIG